MVLTEWGDLLTLWNGQPVEYDTLGNPTAYGYNGHNRREYSWTGRRLDAMSICHVTYTTNIVYGYNGSGERISRTIRGENGQANTTRYIYNGEILAGESREDGRRLEFYYDNNGEYFGLRYNNAEYYYLKNGQNDVTGIVDSTGAVVVKYYYDAWGKQLSVTDGAGNPITDANHVGMINPIRYRGYYYETETGYYWLKTRYYDPEIGRWINADSIIAGVSESVQGYNLFAYCFNNPINMDDQSGYWPRWLKKAAKTGSSVVTHVKAVLTIPSTVVKIATASTVAVVSGQATVGDVWNDVKNYSFFNKDEQKCLDAKVFSSYKGTPVLKQDISGGSMSVCNTIFLSRSEWDVETVKHEWGHTVQQSLMGTPKFMTRIAVPSLIGAALNVDDYYSQPWERSADFFGGATHSYSDNSGFWAGLYYIMP